MREVLRITDQLPRETKKAVRKELREAAEPIRDTAQRELTQFLTSRGTKDPRKHTRYGISVRRTGTVTVEQRVKSKGDRNRRPKFVDLQVDDFLIPAGEKHSGDVDRAMTNVLERLQRKWVTGL